MSSHNYYGNPNEHGYENYDTGQNLNNNYSSNDSYPQSSHADNLNPSQMPFFDSNTSAKEKQEGILEKTEKEDNPFAIPRSKTGNTWEEKIQEESEDEEEHDSVSNYLNEYAINPKEPKKKTKKPKNSQNSNSHSHPSNQPQQATYTNNENHEENKIEESSDKVSTFSLKKIQIHPSTPTTSSKHSMSTGTDPSVSG